MKVSTEIDNNFGYEKITQLVDNIPLNWRLTDNPSTYFLFLFYYFHFPRILKVVGNHAMNLYIASLPRNNKQLFFLRY
jgi:hypothetical protein